MRTGLLNTLGVQLKPDDEMIIADGGSDDGTVARINEFKSDNPSLHCRLVETPRGRARQMNAGAEQARGELLVFLHVDSLLPADFRASFTTLTPQTQWGRFDIRLDDPRRTFRLIERMINLRSRLSGIATGDQCMFVSRALFSRVGGFPAQPLMEDVELSKRLKRIAFPFCIATPPLVTSARKWQQGGVWRTVFLMWRLRAAYALGTSPEQLVRKYYPAYEEHTS